MSQDTPAHDAGHRRFLTPDEIRARLDALDALPTSEQRLASAVRDAPPDCTRLVYERIVVMNPDPSVDEFVEAVITLDEAGFATREIHDEAGSAVIGRMEIDIVRVREGVEDE